VPVVRLTEVFRQAAHSRIITSAHQINRGSIPDLSRPDDDRRKAADLEPYLRPDRHARRRTRVLNISV
jgi:hypothetical protein